MASLFKNGVMGVQSQCRTSFYEVLFFRIAALSRDGRLILNHANWEADDAIERAHEYV
jgi:hypothetical protein